MARPVSSPQSPEPTAGATPAVSLFLSSGKVVDGEVLSGGGGSVIVGLPASGRGLVPLGKPIGLELKDDASPQRISVVATNHEDMDDVSTVRLILSNRATIDQVRGSTQLALFNERAAFRLPVHRESVDSATICSVTASSRSTRPHGPRVAVRGSRFKAKVLDVSFDGLGILVNEETDMGLKGAKDVHIEISTPGGKITVEGLICHRKEFSHGGGIRYGIAAGSSRTARWRVADEHQLRDFVTEQQRDSLSRLRRA